MYSLDEFGEMVGDSLRFPAYREAIARAVKPGDSVVDLGRGPGELRAHYRAVEERARVEPGGRHARRAQYDVQAAMQTRATSLRCASVACVGLRQWSGPTSGREIAIPRKSIGNNAWVYGLV